MSRDTPTTPNESREESDAAHYRRLASRLQTKFPHARPEDVYQAIKTVAHVGEGARQKETGESTVAS